MDEKKVREAIEDLKGIAFKCEGILESLPSKEIERSAYKNIPQSIYIAIEALEKQSPKKPTYEGDGYAPDGTFIWDEWLCPNCGSVYEVDYDDYSYCPNCGQRIDREEEEEL